MFIKILKPLSFIPVITMMYLIFSFSGQNEDLSSQTSYKASYAIVSMADRVLGKGLEEWEIQEYAWRYEAPVRKAAHVAEYFILALAMTFPLFVYGLRGIPLLLLSAVLCVAYAFSDEYHQSFITGRSASLKDVAIDSIGIFSALILSSLAGGLFRLISGHGRKSAPSPAGKPGRRSGRDASSSGAGRHSARTSGDPETGRHFARTTLDPETGRRFAHASPDPGSGRSPGSTPFSFGSAEKYGAPPVQPYPDDDLPDEEVDEEELREEWERFENSPDTLCEDMPFARLFRR